MSSIQGIHYSRLKRIENRASGEIIEAVGTAADTNGACIEGFVTVPPGFDAIPLHRHQQQEEVFEVIRGKVGVELNGISRVYGPGETATIPANTAHRWWNAGDDELYYRYSITPACHFMEIIGCIYRSANERGHVQPSLLDASIILSRYHDEYEPIFLPPPIRLFGLPLLAFLGKLNGRSKTIDGWIAEHYR